MYALQLNVPTVNFLSMILGAAGSSPPPPDPVPLTVDRTDITVDDTDITTDQEET